MVTGKACGKVILSGEHAVVYGTPAIALPVFDCQAVTETHPPLHLSRGVTEISVQPKNIDNNETTVEPDILENGLKPFPSSHAHNSSGIQIIAPQLNQSFIIDLAKTEQNPLELTVINFLKKFDLPLKNIELVINSHIPIASGMGSGAAISTSIIKALAQIYNINITNEQIFEQVFEIEKIYHGNPSGIDPKVIVFEKPYYFIRNVKMQVLDIKAKFVIAIIDSKIKSSTKKVVNWVGEQYKNNQEKYQNIFNNIGKITDNLKETLQSNDISYIGDLIKQNHFYLQEMGVSNSELDKIVNIANQSGAEGSKMSGAGWGGIAIAVLKPENTDKFIFEMKKNSITDIILSKFI